MITKRAATQLLLTQWKVEEYIAYLYLSIAAADMTVSESEMDMICNKVEMLLKRYYPDINVNVPFLLDNLRAVTELRAEHEKIEIIDQLNHKYKLSPDVKNQISSDLVELMNADDKIALSEYHLMHYIRANFS